MTSTFKYIYGPVFSWRIGWSLGIDPISQHEKICNFNCVYCQLDDTLRLENIRRLFVPTDLIIEEIKQLPEIKIDYFTISGRGEPTLASNLGEIVSKIKHLGHAPVAIITNSGLIDRPDVRNDLKLADLVLIKLDAATESSFSKICRPNAELNLPSILDGIHEFRRDFSGKLALQIMFVEENEDQAPKIAEIVRSINPYEVQLNTPLRPCAVKPLSREKMLYLKTFFDGMNVRTVYEASKESYSPLCDSQTTLRHGQFNGKNN